MEVAWAQDVWGSAQQPPSDLDPVADWAQCQGQAMSRSLHQASKPKQKGWEYVPQGFCQINAKAILDFIFVWLKMAQLKCCMVTHC